MREEIFARIGLERSRQDRLHPSFKADQNGAVLSDEVMLAVLAEEVGEVARALLDGDREHLHEELVQVAAVCVRWMEVTA